MTIEFTKMEGLGNDYIYFDCIARPGAPRDIVATAKRLSDRHFGIGGDGIVLMLPHAEADVHMRMFNADGSEAEMCGNAIRCVGKYVYERGYVDRDRMQVQTGNGMLALALQHDADGISGVRVDMGEPVLNGPEIPVAVTRNPVVAERIETDGEVFTATCVSMGNPHCVIFVEDITDELVLNVGPRLEHHPLFPNRTNVEFVRQSGPDILTMRVWERGSGETMACGTGAAAVAVAAVLNDLCGRRVTVRLKGGDLAIDWAADNHVYMTGPATTVFRGSVDLDWDDEAAPDSANS